VLQQNSDNTVPGIVFDVGSGISEAEQQEILEEIEQRVRQDQQSLVEEKNPVKAKKRGLLFPLLVNAAGLLLLGIGLAAIFLTFQNNDATQIRRGTALYNSAERALIREIRRETAQELESKEQEIDQILNKLAGVDTELQDLYSSNQELTAEQKAVEADLQRLQEEYRSNLSSLQDDRSRILEASRAREASLRAQFDERASELTAQATESREALSSARLELERLSTDQEKGAAIEAQLSGLYTRSASYINAGRLGEAAASLNSMREFINTPAFQGVRSIQPRRGFYLSSISTLEGLIGVAEKLAAAVAAAGGQADPGYEKTIAELEERNAALEEQVAASGTAGSGLNRQLNELQGLITSLQGQVSEQAANLATQAQNLEAQQRSNAALESRNTEMTTQNSNLTRQIADLNSTLTERNTAIETLTAQNAEQAASIQNLNTQLATIRQILQGDQQ
jgi:chromosome segregation ATPase